MKQVTTTLTFSAFGPASGRASGQASGLTLGLALALMAACEPVEETPDGGGVVQATFTSLYGDYLATCRECHAPGAPGRTNNIEKTLDFSTQAMAYSTLKNGVATGLIGNPSGCNGAKFISSTAATSLVLAVIDQPTRQAFDLAGSPNCDVDSITDATVKAGEQPSAAFVTAMKTWLNAGAPNN
jgi:hypothetical protein